MLVKREFGLVGFHCTCVDSGYLSIREDVVHEKTLVGGVDMYMFV